MLFLNTLCLNYFDYRSTKYGHGHTTQSTKKSKTSKTSENVQKNRKCLKKTFLQPPSRKNSAATAVGAAAAAPTTTVAEFAFILLGVAICGKTSS